MSGMQPRRNRGVHCIRLVRLWFCASHASVDESAGARRAIRRTTNPARTITNPNMTSSQDGFGPCEREGNSPSINNAMPASMASSPSKARIVLETGDIHITSNDKVSDRRRQERWSARGTHELPPGTERRSGAAVRLHRLVGRVWRLLHGLFFSSHRRA